MGHLKLSLGVFSADGFSDGDDSDGLFRGFGRANIPFSGGAWNLEVETGGAASSVTATANPASGRAVPFDYRSVAGVCTSGVFGIGYAD